MGFSIRDVAMVDRVARSLWHTMLVMATLSVVAVAIGVLFRLSLSGSIGLYFVVWWTALFVVLPVRVRTQAEDGAVLPGSDPGAPSSPALRERAIWTTIVSTIVFAGVAAFFPLAGL